MTDAFVLGEFLVFKDEIDSNLLYFSRPGSNCLVSVPACMFDFVNILINAAESGKYPLDNWLEQDGHTMDMENNHVSMSRHLRASWAEEEKDKDSGLHPALHLACRGLMRYTRWKLGLQHTKDL